MDVAANDIGIVRHTLEEFVDRNIGDTKLIARLAGCVDEIKSSLEGNERSPHVMYNEKASHDSNPCTTPALREIKDKLDTMANASAVAVRHFPREFCFAVY